MKAKLSQRNIKQMVSGSLIIWLSGFLFLFCCESSKVQATEAESCPLAKTNHCSKLIASENNLESASFELEQQAFDCCRFLPVIFNKSVRIEKTLEVGIPIATVKVFQPVFSAANHSFPAPKNFHSVFINRENIHLKNCVFRI